MHFGPDPESRSSVWVISHTGVRRLSRSFLEAALDVIVVAIALVLFALMVRTLLLMAKDVFAPEIDFRTVVAEVLFMLVMLELVRLLLVYLWEHHVAVDSMVEVGIVSTLREVVLRGVVDLEWQRILALALFLLALGFLLRFGDLRIALPETRGRRIS
jgi:uncharacterized membrane protein (DUF373 family)